ncbi:hypothetical protein SAMN05192575_11123 [Nocardioides alpinus]|uniref:Uncharacterized protein n=1 Tax=Nocardioides alpinus TaxID=748909 RepID=A0A1I1AZJ1_9ACTN|nr:hypothetical protein [Nocardioides alpinus]PKH40902.1 hypothetical protein CXG46_10575 [Nocardioides alpinus]SFB41848.1 hypothetical protein SAMN05192575_11123 [Nocardioides alpinus]
MDTGTALLVSVAAGALLGAASSLVTRRVSFLAGILFAAAFAAVGLVVLAARGEEAFAPVVGAMLAFGVVATLLDPRARRGTNWTTGEQVVVGTTFVVLAAFVLTQRNEDGSLSSFLLYLAYMLPMYGVGVWAALSFRSSRR